MVVINYFNMFKKLIYVFGVIIYVNNSYCSDKLTKDEIDEALKDYKDNVVVESIEIKEYLTQLASCNKLSVDEYNTRIEELKKKYINCFYLKEYTEDDLRKFVDKNNERIFKDNDIKIYNSKKKVFKFLSEKTLKKIEKKLMSDVRCGNEDDVLKECFDILKEECYGKYKILFKPYVKFFYSIYYHAVHGNGTVYEDIYIYVYDYGYTGDDIEKIGDNLVIKNTNDLNKVIKSFQFPVDRECDFLEALYKYADFLGNNNEKFESIKELNERIFCIYFSNILPKLKENEEKVDNGEFTIKTEKTDIIKNVFLLGKSDEETIKEMRDKIAVILKDFDSLNELIGNVNVKRNININKYKYCFIKMYSEKFEKYVKNLYECINENKSIGETFDFKLRYLKDYISKLKNIINGLCKKNDLLDDGLKNEDIYKYDDDYFDGLMYKDSDKCTKEIKELNTIINGGFKKKKNNLKDKYLGIKKNKEKLCEEDKKKNHIEKEKVYDEPNFFTKLDVDSFKSVEKEIIDLEVKMNDIIKAREVNDNEVKLKAEAERRKKLEEEKKKKEEEKRKKEEEEILKKEQEEKIKKELEEEEEKKKKKK